VCLCGTVSVSVCVQDAQELPQQTQILFGGAGMWRGSRKEAVVVVVVVVRPRLREIKYYMYPKYERSLQLVRWDLGKGKVVWIYIEHSMSISD